MEPLKRQWSTSLPSSQGLISIQTSLSLPTSGTSTFLTELSEDIQLLLGLLSRQQSHATLTVSLHVRPNPEENEPSKQ